MKSKPKVIFYGNGLNRISEGIDWNGLLDSIGNNSIRSKITTNTMRYEVIYLSKDISPISQNTPSQETSEFEIKRSIAQKLREQQKTNDTYKRLAHLPFTDYITTNYDHSLEQTLLEIGYKEENSDMTESIYNIHRFRRFYKDGDVKRIWHIHGDLDKPRCIMLGYDHYCGGLTRINEYIKGSYNPSKAPSHRVKKIGERLSNEISPSDIKSWIDIFFISDIHFIGYGLDYTEIDIWWILNKRMRMIKERKISIDNKIFFHSIGNSAARDTEKATVLDAFGVKYNNCSLNKDYATSYNEILADIQ